MSEFNDNNEYHINIDVNAAGYAEHAIAVEESGYTNSIKSNDIFVGKVLSVTYADLKLDAITLSFNLNDDVIMQSTDVLYDELKGINRFQVVRMNSDNNMLEPVKTEINNSTLTVETNQTGDYCILDVSKLLSQYGVEVSSNISNYSLKGANKSDLPSNGPVDVVFMVDCSGTEAEGVFRTYLEEIEIASEAIFDRCYDARISIIQFTNSARKVTFSNGEEWASNIVQVRELLSQLQYTPTCTQSNYGSAQGVMFNSTKFRDEAVRFGFTIFSLPSIRYTGGNKNAAKKLLEKDIKWGYVCRGNMSVMEDMYMTIDYGTTLVYSSYFRSFGSDIAEVVYTTTVDAVTPYIVLGYDLKQVKLIGPLSRNSARDTDGDGLSDSREINWDKFQMMTMLDFLGYTNQVGVLSKLSPEERDKLMRTKIYPVHSNPTKVDSDGDGIVDCIKYFDSDEYTAQEIGKSLYHLTEFDDPNPLKFEYLWQWPLLDTDGNKVSRIRSGFYEKRDHKTYSDYHSAIDISATDKNGIIHSDYQVIAAYDGILKSVKEISWGGCTIEIEHTINGRKYVSRYCHMLYYDNGNENHEFVKYINMVLEQRGKEETFLKNIWGKDDVRQYNIHVKAGTPIGIASGTKSSSERNYYGKHLDFRIDDLENKRIINPISFCQSLSLSKIGKQEYKCDMLINVPIDLCNVCEHDDYHEDGTWCDCKEESKGGEAFDIRKLYKIKYNIEKPNIEEKN